MNSLITILAFGKEVDEMTEEYWLNVIGKKNRNNEYSVQISLQRLLTRLCIVQPNTTKKVYITKSFNTLLISLL